MSVQQQEQERIDFAKGRLVTAKEKQRILCQVKGSIPRWLSGEVIRNGPGEFEKGPDKFVHLFDGHAFIHKFAVKDGQVTYTAQFVKTEMYKTNTENNRILVGGFGTKSYPDPCKNFFSRFFTVLTTTPKSDNCNVNIASFGNAHYAITDGGIAYRFDPETLETKNLVDMNEILNVPLSTAHPHYDRNGDYYNFATSFGRKSFYNVVKVPASSSNKEDPLKDLQIHARIPNDTPLSPTYQHSFALTENYMVFHDQPYRVNVTKLLWKVKTWQAALSAFQSDETRKSQFCVIDKNTGEVLKTQFTANGEFCFHFVNGFETTSEGKRFIVIDLCCVLDFNMSEGLFLLENMKNAVWKEAMTTAFKRFVIPLDVDETSTKESDLVTIEGCPAQAVLQEDGSVFLTPEILIPNDVNPGQLELPRINYSYNGKQYRYFYSVSAFDEDGGGHLFKFDIANRKGTAWKQPGCIPSEPVFVERSGATEEDDGVVVSTVINQDPKQPVFLLILDARSFTELARAEVNTNLGMSFHGIFKGCT